MSLFMNLTRTTVQVRSTMGRVSLAPLSMTSARSGFGTLTSFQKRQLNNRDVCATLMRLYNIVPLGEDNPLPSRSQRARSCMLCTSVFATQAIT
jgi:hypothetical protein